jgi:hypothetical protein
VLVSKRTKFLTLPGLLRPSFRPAAAMVPLRSFMRQGETMVEEISARILWMQKAVAGAGAQQQNLGWTPDKLPHSTLGHSRGGHLAPLRHESDPHLNWAPRGSSRQGRGHHRHRPKLALVVYRVLTGMLAFNDLGGTAY